MSELTCNGARVLRGRITLPREGVWHAEFELDTAGELVGPLVIESAEGVRLVGALHRGGAYQESTMVQVDGGAGRLATVLPPKFWRQATAQIVARDMLEEAGERLSPTSDATLLSRRFDAWTREQSAAGGALTQLTDVLGAIWRVLPDGTVWIGRESWPEAEVELYDLLVDDTASGAVVIATDAIATGLRPGMMFRRQRVSSVEHQIESASLRTTVSFEREDSPGDRLTAALEAIVRGAMRGVLFHGRFAGRVVSQHEDGTVDIVMDAPALPGLTRVPLRTFAPGVSVKVANGSRVMVGWADVSGQKPFADVFESGAGALDRLDIASPDIRLGGGEATDFVALASKVESALAKLQNALDTHTHSGGTLAGALTGPPSTVPTVMPVGALGGVGASKVKAT